MPLMMCSVTSLPVPPQPGAWRPQELLAKAANTMVLRIRSNFVFLLLVQNAFRHTCFYMIIGSFV